MDTAERESLRHMFMLMVGLVDYLVEAQEATKTEQDERLEFLKVTVSRTGASLVAAGVKFEDNNVKGDIFDDRKENR